MTYAAVVLQHGAVTIDDLLKKSFIFRSREEQIRILQNGKPRPRLRNAPCLTSNRTTDAANCSTFDIEIYDQREWLTGCDKRQALFCWPCLLFGKTRSAYNTRGVLWLEVRDVQDSDGQTADHERCMEHIQAMLDLQMFIRRYVVQDPISNSEHNELVRRNREILRRVIDVACLVVSQKKPSRPGTHEKNQLKVEDCVRTLSFLQAYDAQEDNIIQDAIDLLQISPNIVNDCVYAIAALVKSSIKKETQQSTFVSMILSEHSTSNDGKLQISTVLRYIKNGNVCEKFVGFHSFNEVTLSSTSIMQHISSVAAEFNITQRLLAFAIDGAVLRKKQLLGSLLKHFPTSYPYTVFVPCYFHNFHRVLQDSLSVFTVCDTFFKTMIAIGNFLEKNRTKKTGFECFIEKKVSRIDKFEFVKSSNSLSYMKMLRRHLIEYFDSLLKNCEVLKADDFAKVYGYRQALTEITTIFLLEAFIKLFSITDSIDKILASDVPERVFDDCVITEIQKSLENEKSNGFNQVWNSFLAEMPSSSMFEDSDTNYHRAVFLDLVDVLNYQVNHRLEHLRQLEFFNLLNFSWESKSKYTSPRVLVALLIAIYGSSFHQVSLLAEIQLLHTKNTNLIGKSVEQFLQYLIDANQQGEYKNLYKLTELILTMPCKPPMSANEFSISEKINKWAYAPINIAGDFSILAIEENCFSDIKRKKYFYDDVISKFQDINKTMDFLSYKEF